MSAKVLNLTFGTVASIQLSIGGAVLNERGLAGDMERERQERTAEMRTGNPFSRLEFVAEEAELSAAGHRRERTADAAIKYDNLAAILRALCPQTIKSFMKGDGPKIIVLGTAP